MAHRSPRPCYDARVCSKASTAQPASRALGPGAVCTPCNSASTLGSHLDRYRTGHSHTSRPRTERESSHFSQQEKPRIPGATATSRSKSRRKLDRGSKQRLPLARGSSWWQRLRWGRAYHWATFQSHGALSRPMPCNCTRSPFRRPHGRRQCRGLDSGPGLYPVAAMFLLRSRPQFFLLWKTRSVSTTALVTCTRTLRTQRESPGKYAGGPAHAPTGQD